MSGVHQVLAGAAQRDAITNHALAARDVIRAMGLRSEVFCEADHIDPSLAGEVLAHTAWDARTGAGDTAILHYSIASAAFWEIADRGGPVAIHYHNITPAELLWEYAPQIALECQEGRRRLVDLAPRVSAAAADSAFNAAELADLGFPNPAVIGVMRRAHLTRSHAVRSDRLVMLFVGRGVPNKAQHDLVLALAAVREAGVDAELRLVGSWAGVEEYRAFVQALADSLGVSASLVITGSVDDEQLADEYAAASVFVCMSDHEGYCVPLVEAMEHDTPIVAYEQGAVAETAGRAALLLDDKTPSLVAEAILEALSNRDLRADMARARAERLADLSLERVAGRVRDFVQGLE